MVEQYLAQHAHLLTEAERTMLSGWTDVEGLFEIDSVQRDVLMLHHLRDDLDYQAYTNAGRGALAGLKKGMFVYGRVGPVHPDSDAWPASGATESFPKSAAGAVAQAALFSDVSRALRRNPALRERSWAMQWEYRSRFIEIFGADWAILPPSAAEEKLRELYRRRTEAALAKVGARSRTSAESVAQTLEALPPDLPDSESVGLIFDEAEGLCFTTAMDCSRNSSPRRPRPAVLGTRSDCTAIFVTSRSHRWRSGDRSRGIRAMPTRSSGPCCAGRVGND